MLTKTRTRSAKNPVHSPARTDVAATRAQPRAISPDLICQSRRIGRACSMTLRLKVPVDLGEQDRRLRPGRREGIESSRTASESISPKNCRNDSTRAFKSARSGLSSARRTVRSRTRRLGSSSRRLRSVRIRRKRVHTSVSARNSSRRSPGRWTLWTTPQARSSRRFMLTLPRETPSHARRSSAVQSVPVMYSKRTTRPCSN